MYFVFIFFFIIFSLRIIFRKKNSSRLAPMEANILFGLGFSPKDIANSGREVLMKTNRSAPKKKHQSCEWCLLLFVIASDSAAISQSCSTCALLMILLCSSQ
jgi:hypothetical protein